MGLRFYRRVHLCPGLSLNVSRSGPRLTFGVRGAHLPDLPVRWIVVVGVQPMLIQVLAAPGAPIVVLARAAHGHHLTTKVLARIEARPAVAVASCATLESNRSTAGLGAGKAPQLFLRRLMATLGQVAHHVAAARSRRR